MLTLHGRLAHGLPVLQFLVSNDEVYVSTACVYRESGDQGIIVEFVERMSAYKSPRDDDDGLVQPTEHSKGVTPLL